MRLINIDQLQEGMQLGQDIYDEHNRLLLGRGAAIRGTYVLRLKEIGLPALYVQDDDTSDIQVPQTIQPVARARAIQTLGNTFNTVSKSLEGFRQVSVDEAQQHIRSPRFMDNIKSITADGGLDQMIGDVDGLIDQLMNREVIVGLNSIKTHDSYTFQHSLDVAIMGVLLARKFGWEKERLTAFGIGCLLHDLGKIFIENEVLNKPGKLSEEEFELMKAHPTLGYEVVKTIAPHLSHLIPHVAFQHHERQDGSGYPRGVPGNRALDRNLPNTIHDFGAVAAVADIYDAMTSDRPYRQGWAPDKVVHLIRNLAGTHLNARVVEIFLLTVTPYPIGTGIKVLNGPNADYEGVVSDVDDRDLSRPKVRLLFDPSGNRIDALEIDLSAEEDIQVECVRNGEPEMESLGSSSQVLITALPEKEPEPDSPVGAEPNESEIVLKQPIVVNEEAVCPSCGFQSKGNFCTECGTALNAAT